MERNDKREHVNIEEILKQLENKIQISFKGFMSEEERSELEKYCYIHSDWVYMDGSAYYSIRKKE